MGRAQVAHGHMQWPPRDLTRWAASPPPRLAPTTSTSLGRLGRTS